MAVQVKHLLSMKKEMFTQVLLRLDMMCPDMAGERRSLMSKTTGGDGLEVPPEAKGDTPQV